MDEPRPPERPIAEVREIGADLKYRWSQAKATGDAEALSRVLELAKEAGLPPEQLSQITEGFVAIADELLRNDNKKRRRDSFRWRRRKDSATRQIRRPRQIDPGERPPQLPPGKPE